MKDTRDSEELLREALIELRALREREASALRASTVLLSGLERMSSAASAAEALTELLALVHESLGCDAALVVRRVGEGARVVEASPAALRGASVPAPLATRRKPLGVPDLGRLAWWRDVPAPLAGMRALLSAPMTLAAGPGGAGPTEGAILALSGGSGSVTPADRALLVRLAALASQALERLALAERNATLAAVIEGAAASVSIADATRPDCPLVYVNQAFLDLSGYDRAAVLGENCRFLAADDANAPERRRLREAVAARSAGTFELRNRARDGRTFWNRLTLYPVHDPDGAVRFMVATQVDITAERAAAEERDLARRRLVNALSATSEGFLLVDPAGRVVFANPRFRDFFGAAGADWSEGADFVRAWTSVLEARGLSPEAARRGARARRDRLFGGGAALEERLPDGRILLVSDRPTGGGGAVSIATDITSLKATERLLAQRAAAIDAAEDGIAVTDEAGRFIYINRSHLDMFGYEEPHELLGRRWSVLYDEEMAETIRTRVMPEVGARGSWRGELTGRARDGSPVAQEVQLTAMPEVGLICVTRDISERRRAERERERLAEQLQAAQRQEAVGQLAAGVAHDFNNLLSAITGSAALLDLEIGAEHPGHSHVERITAAGARASELVRRLIEIGRRPARPRRIDLARPFAEAADLLRAGLPSSIVLEVGEPGGPLDAEADPTAFVQVALNLGINARDAMKDRPGVLRFALAAVRPEAEPEGLAVGTVRSGRSYCLLSVADTGSGIPPDQLGTVFKPYFSTKGADGTGLGLAVVASIIRACGGAVALRSRVGEGTTFDVYWPLAPTVLPEPAAAPDDDAPEGGGDRPLAARTVLVCDDDGPVAQVMAAILERVGAETAVCEDPRDALDAIRDDPGAWDLLVTDHDMPQMTGAVLARAARIHAPDMPILLCTALTDEGHAAGIFDAVLSKPVDPERLRKAAAALVVRSRSGEG